MKRRVPVPLEGVKATVLMPNGKIVYVPVRLEIDGKELAVAAETRGLVAQQRVCWEVAATRVELDLETSKFLTELIASFVFEPCDSDAPACRRGTMHFRGSVVDWLRWRKTLDQYIHGERGVTCHD